MKYTMQAHFSQPTDVAGGHRVCFIRFRKNPPSAVFSVSEYGETLLDFDIVSVPLSRIPKKPKARSHAKSWAKKRVLAGLAKEAA